MCWQIYGKASEHWIMIAEEEKTISDNDRSSFPISMPVLTRSHEMGCAVSVSRPSDWLMVRATCNIATCNWLSLGSAASTIVPHDLLYFLCFALCEHNYLAVILGWQGRKSQLPQNLVFVYFHQVQLLLQDLKVTDDAGNHTGFIHNVGGTFCFKFMNMPTHL